MSMQNTTSRIISNIIILIGMSHSSQKPRPIGNRQEFNIIYIKKKNIRTHMGYICNYLLYSYLGIQNIKNVQEKLLKNMYIYFYKSKFKK